MPSHGNPQTTQCITSGFIGFFDFHKWMYSSPVHCSTYLLVSSWTLAHCDGSNIMQSLEQRFGYVNKLLSLELGHPNVRCDEKCTIHNTPHCRTIINPIFCVSVTEHPLELKSLTCEYNFAHTRRQFGAADEQAVSLWEYIYGACFSTQAFRRGIAGAPPVSLNP